MTLKKIFLNLRVIIALIFLVAAIAAINPNLDLKGVALRNIAFNSSADLAGMQSPKPATPPRSREIIFSINDQIINSVQDYHEAILDLQINQSIIIRTNKNKEGYRLLIKPQINITILNETMEKIIQEAIPLNLSNGTTVYQAVNRTILVNKTLETIVGAADPGLKVYETPATNIRKGLDLQGGTRVLLKPREPLSASEMDILLSNINERLNVFGLSDVVVRTASDLPVYLGGQGNQFILVEIAGANEEEVKELLSKQGKFEAKIGDQIVFSGGKKDVSYVCRTIMSLSKT